jgi:hypothetical protein
MEERHVMRHAGEDDLQGVVEWSALKYMKQEMKNQKKKRRRKKGQNKNCMEYLCIGQN